MSCRANQETTRDGEIIQFLSVYTSSQHFLSWNPNLRSKRIASADEKWGLQRPGSSRDDPRTSKFPETMKLSLPSNMIVAATWCKTQPGGGQCERGACCHEIVPRAATLTRVAQNLQRYDQRQSVKLIDY